MLLELLLGLLLCLYSRDIVVAAICENGSVRVSPNSSYGAVEVCLNSTWGSICTDFWDNNDASVVCKQLGYSPYGAIGSTIVYYFSSAIEHSIVDLNCIGNESTILDCPYNFFKNSCSLSKDANIFCQPLSVANYSNCSDGDVRLVGGTSKFEGRVEVCLNRAWGTVCAYNWDSQEAQIVCNQLGYSDYVGKMGFSEGTGPILFGYLDCNGTEANLVECTQNYNNTHTYCQNHSYDVAIVCENNNTVMAECENGDVRLVVGNTQHEGRVEVCINGVWVIVFCGNEVDSVYNLFWNETYVGNIITQSCPPGRSGDISRQCTVSGLWSEISQSACPLDQLMKDLDKLKNITSDNANFTAQEQNDVINNITQNIVNVTQTALTTSDVITINNIVDKSIVILTSNIGDKSITNPFLETEILDVFNNLLDDQHVDELSQLNDDFGGEKLMSNIEDYGKYAGKFLVFYDNITNDTFAAEKENLVFQVDIQDKNHLSDVIFPLTAELPIYTVNDSFSQVRIPYQHLKDRQTEDNKVAVVNALINNIAKVLPASLTNLTENVPVTQVITTQVISSNTSSQIPAVFNFTTVPLQNESNPRCAFLDFPTASGNGTWSTDGIELVSMKYETTLKGIQYNLVCNSSHITPFVVLVDLHGVEIPKDEYIALEVVTYVGLTVSSVGCILTIVVLLTLKKELIQSVQYLLHFNLSIALLGGYVIFIFGIDDKFIDLPSSKIGCGFIAALLHYFFLAAFCWMLCEGIMLFLQLVIVFSSLSKRWYIYLLIGWGLPIIPVGISVSILYESYGVLGKYCWINVSKQAAIWAFLGPALLIILINIVLLMLAIQAMARYYKRRQQDSRAEDKKKGDIIRKTIIGSLILLPLLGITWPLGLFVINRHATVFAWLFTIFSTFQGCFIFVFNVIRNEKIKNTLFQLCCPKLSKKSRQQEAIKLGRTDRYHRQHISNFDNSIDYHSSTQYTRWNTSESMAFHNRMYLGYELQRPRKNRLPSDISFSPTEIDQEQRFFGNSTLPSITVTEFDM